MGPYFDLGSVGREELKEDKRGGRRSKRRRVREENKVKDYTGRMDDRAREGGIDRGQKRMETEEERKGRMDGEKRVRHRGQGREESTREYIHMHTHTHAHTQDNTRLLTTHHYRAGTFLLHVNTTESFKRCEETDQSK